MKDHKVHKRRLEAHTYRFEARYFCPKAAQQAKVHAKRLERKARRLEARLFIQAGLEELDQSGWPRGGALCLLNISVVTNTKG